MVGRVGNAPTLVLLDFCFTGSPRSLRDYRPGKWLAAALVWRAAALGQKRTNTAVSSFELTPAGHFTADLSMFQAHLLLRHTAAKPLELSESGLDVWAEPTC